MLCLLGLTTAGMAGGCALLTTPVAAVTKAGLGPKIPPAYDLQKQPTWVRVTADERVVGTDVVLASDPVAVEARRAFEASRETVAADVASRAKRLVVVDLGVPDDHESILGSPFTKLTAVARVRVYDDLGVELWPADGTRGKLVQARLSDDARGTQAELQRQVHRELGRSVAALFVSHRDG